MLARRSFGFPLTCMTRDSPYEVREKGAASFVLRFSNFGRTFWVASSDCTNKGLF